MKRDKIILIVQSVLCVVLAVLLAAAVIGICRRGLALKADDPLSWIFTRERLAAALGPVLPLLLVSLAVSVAGLVLGVRDKNGSGPVQDTESLRDLTVSRTAAPSAGMRAERVRQKRLLHGGRAVFALCMLPVLLYLTDGAHFPNGDLEPVFLALIGQVLPWTAMGLAALMLAAALREKSMRREIEAAREQIRREKAEGVKPETRREAPQTQKGIRLLRVALLVLAVALIAAGVLNGSARDVFGKAVKICTECVGLG